MKRCNSFGVLAGLFLAWGSAAGCSPAELPPESGAQAPSGQEDGANPRQEEVPPAQGPEAQTEAAPSVYQTDEAIRRLTETWTGDLDGMVERRVVRMLVTLSKTNYFLDLEEQRGVTYEGGRLFEDEVNKKLGSGVLRLNVVFIPVTRDQLLPALIEGRGDIAAANLTITPERQAEVDFSAPLLSDVRELVVTGSSAPPLASLEDLSGKEVYVRESSSYYASLLRLNERFRAEGREPVRIKPADELLEDEDILEMVNAGVVPITIVDSHIGEFWAQILEITLHRDLAVREGGQIAWAIRKGSPKLKGALDDFSRSHGKGTLMGNILFKRYLQNTDYIKNPHQEEEVARLRAAADLFRKYAGQYNFDWLMVAAQSYQESGIDQSVRSPVGAVGVMQVLPSTAADRNVNVPNIEEIENNIHAGVKYMRFVADHYFSDQPMDDLNKALFAFASYNAGPAKVARLRKEAAEQGLDPNRWFRNVEVIAAKRIGRETVQYVSNIYKYYVSYKLIAETLERKRGVAAGTP